ncbi:conserved protein of unknown function [Nitrospira japonica]|uniref:Phosphodiester glycosidase domain-containing protein n=1 Tax=Nitrospira japonica TaxID=1325564 RepID=A0A1W1I381_9BACT|nr:hypothetical protein [Nitrospira japonica]SLM47466.1 conserved protein of unknown function [Nitrospira japonica]
MTIPTASFRPSPFIGLSRFLCLLFISAMTLLPGGPTAAWARPPSWEQVADGLRVTLWTTPCPDVPPLILIAIDPRRYRFSVHYYRNEGLAQPPDIHEWQTRTGHDLVFNAGLFRENFAYLGLLFGNGMSLGGKQHGTWLGLFVAEPTRAGDPPAKILDLAVESFDVRELPYQEAAQSLMLLDENGTVRVRRSGKQAQQTILAEEIGGPMLVVKTTQPATLFDIGQCLHEEFPTIRRAMAMDGGSSSDVALGPVLRRNATHADLGAGWMPFFADTGSGHIGLPAVIGISPRHSSAPATKTPPRKSATR